MNVVLGDSWSRNPAHLTTQGTRGEGFLDIHLNATTRWKDVPIEAWNYTLGAPGYAPPKSPGGEPAPLPPCTATALFEPC